MYVLYQHPQISETYIRSEIEAVRDQCELRVFSLRAADAPYKNHEPYVLSDDVEELERAIQEFKPQVLHTHWLNQTRELAYLAGYFGKMASGANLPFTVRAHSFDVLDHDQQYVRDAAPLINSELCLGVLTFPFTLPYLRKNGVREDKIFSCWPVINYARFHDESPNGPDVMNVGACLPKKQMEDFLKLAKMVQDRRFDLYAMGYNSKDIDRLNKDLKYPVRIIPSVEPELMLPEYKKHQWLVYTASTEMGTVGWSLAVAEAQAAGVGVCFPRLRPDLEEYIGPAGYLYDTIEEVAEIITKPFPEEKRRLGFEHAKRSDIAQHKEILLNLWRKAAGMSDPPAHVRGSDSLKDWGKADTVLEHGLRTRQMSRDIENYIPENGSMIEAGDASQWVGLRGGRRVLPFIEKDGQFWGPPESDAVAISELERMRASGAGALFFRSDNFWWLDHYKEFGAHLRKNYKVIVEDSKKVVFDLTRKS
jgi:hypothetical protein